MIAYGSAHPTQRDRECFHFLNREIQKDTKEMGSMVPVTRTVATTERYSFPQQESFDFVSLGEGLYRNLGGLVKKRTLSENRYYCPRQYAVDRNHADSNY